MSEPQDLILLWCILDFGWGSKVLQLAREIGSFGEVLFLGKGTVKEKWLNLLGATEKRKEIVVSLVNKDLEAEFYARATKEFELTKPGRGIAFSTPMLSFVKLQNQEKLKGFSQKRGLKQVEYEAIFVVVNKGLAVEVIEAAESAGSTGGTLIQGRGLGSQEKARLFNIEIEPEKDVVLILSKKEQTKKIAEAIEEQLEITRPGAGIVFVLPVSRTLGLYGGGLENSP